MYHNITVTENSLADMTMFILILRQAVFPPLQFRPAWLGIANRMKEDPRSECHEKRDRAGDRDTDTVDGGIQILSAWASVASSTVVDFSGSTDSVRPCRSPTVSTPEMPSRSLMRSIRSRSFSAMLSIEAPK